MLEVTTKADSSKADSGETKPKEKNYSHVKPVAPVISLNKPGRLRTANMLALFGVSASTFYDGIQSGRYPERDGYDGKMPYWFTHTVRKYLLIASPKKPG